VLKVEFHAHTSDDPADRIPHSTAELIDRAAALGYDAVAVTLHDRQLDLSPGSGTRLIAASSSSRGSSGRSRGSMCCC